jgi:hypothetical protein
MLKITIKSSLLQEGRSKQRWRQTASNAIAHNIIKAIKSNPEKYMKNGVYPFSITEMVMGIVPLAVVKKLRELKLAVIVDPTIKQSVDFKGGAYMYEDPRQKTATIQFPRKSDLTNRTDIEPLEYTMSTGDLTLKVVIKNAGVLPDLSMLHNKISSNINHELSHFADDIGGGVGSRTEPTPKELSRDNTGLVNRLNTNFLQPTEIRAYATQVMSDSRKTKTRFLDNLEQKAVGLSGLFKRNANQEQMNLVDSVFKIWKFKIIDYVMNKYNIFNKRDANNKLDQESQAIRIARAKLSKEVEKIAPSLFGGE